MWLLRFALALCISLSPFWSSAVSGQVQVTSDFDSYFESASRRYLWGLLPEDDWRWWKAQCYQESRLKADAVSPAGASGICQIMPAAAQDAQLRWIDRYHAAKNIQAGAFIQRRCTRMWWVRPTRLDRLKLGWSCYNSGGGNILKAQTACEDAMLWEQISPCLPEITGRHAKETQDYVRLIPKWYQEIAQ